MRKFLFSMLFVAATVSMPIVFSSCFEEIEAGLHTVVAGRVIDTVKSKGIENASVIIWGCKGSFYGLGCSDIVDITRTDHLGRFSMSFTTAGTTHAYEVSVVDDSNVILPGRDTVIAGTRNQVTLYARELSVLKINAVIEKNSVGTIRIQSPGQDNDAQILKQTRDTIVYGKVIPNSENIIYYHVNDTSIREWNKTRFDRDTIFAGLNDTTTLNKIFTDPGLWPRP